MQRDWTQNTNYSLCQKCLLINLISHPWLQKQQPMAESQSYRVYDCVMPVSSTLCLQNRNFYQINAIRELCCLQQCLGFTRRNNNSMEHKLPGRGLFQKPQEAVFTENNDARMSTRRDEQGSPLCAADGARNCFGNRCITHAICHLNVAVYWVITKAHRRVCVEASGPMIRAYDALFNPFSRSGSYMYIKKSCQNYDNGSYLHIFKT